MPYHCSMHLPLPTPHTYISTHHSNKTVTKKERTNNQKTKTEENNHQPMYSLSSSDSSSCCLNENGANGHPPNSANLEKDSTHARRNE